MSLVNDGLLLARAFTSGWSAKGGPFKLTVAVTWQCDQRCTHCRIWRRPRTEELTAGEWRRVWREASGTLSWLDLTGGEVTSRPDFAEIAIAAVEECPRLAMLHFPSNGRDPDLLVETVRAVQSADPSRLILSLSIDGPPETHERLRGDKGAWQKTVESFRRIRALGVEVYFGMTLSPWNVDLLEPTWSALAGEIDGLSWRDLHVNFLHVSPHYFGNEGIQRNDPEALAAAIEAFVARRGLPRRPTHLLEHLYLRHVPEHLRSGRSPLPCASLTGNAFIDPEGCVYPCHIWDEPVANLREHGYSLAAVWTLQRAITLRGEVEADRCPGCWTPCEAYPTLLSNLARAAR